MADKIKLKSKIKKFFPMECLQDLFAITYSACTNEEKGRLVEYTLDKYEIKAFLLGHGTNRIGIQIEDTVFKIALDEHGKTDNKREFKYTDKLQPYVIKVYECLQDGLIEACEPVIPMDKNEFVSNKNTVLHILSKFEEKFFIGDVGYDPNKNYANWGFRKSDGQVVVLDFAYIYSSSYQMFRCNSCEAGSVLIYDEGYNGLVCPSCGKKYTFAQIRKRISKQDEKNEIGDLFHNNYVIHSPEEEVVEHYEYTYSEYYEMHEEQRKKEEKKARKKFVKELRAKARGEVKKEDPKLMYQKLMDKARSMGLNPEDYEPGGKYYITSNEQYYNSIKTGTNN